VHLAQVFGGEIISADSRQVYRGVDIGMAKESGLPVPQHLIDIKEPGEKITVAEFQSSAYEVIDRLLAQKKLPIMVGGTGLYAEAVINGYIFDGPGGKAAEARYESLVLGIAWDRAVLRERIAERTQIMLQQGLLQEIECLLAAGVDPEWLQQSGQPYKYFMPYLRGELTLEEATDKTNIDIGQYAKRQDTWWRRFGQVVWVQTAEEAEAAVDSFLHP